MVKQDGFGWGGKALRGWRKNQEISQESLGDVLEVSGAYLSQVESGERRPGFELMRRIRDLTGIELDAWS